jgi:diaminopimelate epimerase
MQLQFYKYQGAGNDFILIDNRSGVFNSPSPKTVSKLCDRRFGIGADGLMLLQLLDGYDFEMIYYNADGNPGSMCGNGGRCIAAFAHFLGIVEKETKFMAVDGEHEAKIPVLEFVELKMGKVQDIFLSESHCYLNTGSPHDIRFVENADETDVYNTGRNIRYNEPYRLKGVNVNFVEITDKNCLKVYTYERGVEDETLACGTGVTASALAYFLQKTDKKEGFHKIAITVKGGKLSVHFQFEKEEFYDIWLCGPAVQVFDGVIDLS